MAKSTAASDDEKHPQKSDKANQNSNVNDTEQRDDPVEADEEEEEIYEIEEILEAKRGVFPNGRMGYFVKWKGYPPDENSWVDENDANAPELIADFWSKNKKGRKSMDKPAAKPRRRESEPAETSKKRGRKSQPVETDDEQDSKPLKASKRSKQSDTDDGEPKAPVAKKKKSVNAKKAAADIVMDDDEGEVKDMSQYYSHDSWEDLIDVIDTVENDGNVLYVYCRLKNGDRIKETSRRCYAKCPQKMLRFYESNLRWREAEVEEPTNNGRN